MLHFKEFDPNDEAHVVAAVELWNAACGPDLAITRSGVRYNMRPSPGTEQAGRFAMIGGRPVGFALAMQLAGGDPCVSPRDLGWIDAIAVAPSYAGRGIGSLLLNWAESWLTEAGCTRFRLGGSVRPFAPGLPSGLPSERFFRRRGYSNRLSGPTVWDLARDIRGYETAAFIRPLSAGEIRPAGEDDAPALSGFFGREFRGRWEYEYDLFRQRGGRIGDLTILVVGDRVEGFCWLTFEDSSRSLDRVFMNRLPRPWGQLGPVGISQAMRRGGFGAAVLDAGLRRLRDAGVAGCVIDWTDLLDFYGKFGFKPYRQYEVLLKEAAQ